ncbi:hypothetical protein FIBSPDRAFT_361326 [Athelia psychrophila]|uniref:Uncharacterized protein n=1 Tax=Athelia psychrophila TaxID=1759441 RepID=A0A167VLY0_9AGAM|nr:hypothetical protein FIBSPDRAFT_361326 [Fibularhizoctonia sp. CBS 109695]
MQLDALPRQRRRDVRAAISVHGIETPAEEVKCCTRWRRAPGCPSSRLRCCGPRRGRGKGVISRPATLPLASNPGSSHEVEVTATSTASCRPCTLNPPTRGLNTSVPVLITPLNSRSTRVVLHFPSSQSTCATTRASTVLFAFIPPSSITTLVSFRARALRCVAPPDSARAPRSSPTANQRLSPRSRRAHHKATYRRGGNDSPWRDLWKRGAVVWYSTRLRVMVKGAVRTYSLSVRFKMTL